MTRLTWWPAVGAAAGDKMDLKAINAQIANAVASTPAASPAKSGAGSEFSSSLDAALKAVSRGQAQAEEMQRQFALENPNVGLEDAVVAMSKASISFAAAVQVRNRLVQAYEQIMTMQV
jgi:flagellar hook-basal body complex protein FliE